MTICLKSTLSAPLSDDATGILLKYHPFISLDEKVQLNQILMREGIKNKKFYPHGNIVFFTFLNSMKDEKVNRLCKRLLAFSFVASCDSNKKLKGKNSDENILACQQETISDFTFLKDFVQKQNECDIYIGEKSFPFPLQTPELISKNGHTPFWAQEYIGADLARKDFSRIKNPQEEDFLLAIIDSPSYNHRENVQGLITDIGPQAVIGPIKQMQSESLHYMADYLDVEESYKRSAKFPRYISNSMGWHDSEVIKEALKRISENETIIVTAAGNESVEIEEAKKRGIDEFGALVVASMSPEGEPSGFSNYHEGVVISAPSNKEILSAFEDGESSIFGGTSAATPLVTGSLLAFELNSQGRLNSKQARSLIEKTAILTSFSKDPKGYGRGSLNTYLMAAIGEKIGQICKGDQACINELLEKKETFSFPKVNYEEEIKNTFPSCRGQDKTTSDHSTDCERREVLDLIRRQAFLNPKDPNSWNDLACIYKSLNLEGNAHYYSKIAYSNLAFSKEGAIKLKEDLLQGDLNLSLQAAKSLANNPTLGIDILKKGMNGENLQSKLASMYGLRLLNQETGIEAAEAGVFSDKEEIQKLSFEILILGPDKSLPTIMNLLSSGDREKLNAGASLTKRLGSSALIRLIELAKSSGNKEIELIALKELSQRSDVTNTKFLLSLYDSSPDNRELVFKVLNNNRNEFSNDQIDSFVASSDNRKRALAAAHLASKGSSRDYNNLKILLESTDESVSEHAASVYLVDVDKIPFDLISTGLISPHENTRAKAISAMAGLGDNAPLDALEKALFDPSSLVRARASEVLALQGERGVALVKKLLKSDELEYRKLGGGVIQKMGALADPELIDLALDDKNLDVRLAAARALTKFGDQASVELLLKVLGDKSERVVGESSNILKGLKDKIDRDVVKMALATKNKYILNDIPTIFEALGQKPENRDFLLEFLDNKNPKLRLSAFMGVAQGPDKEVTSKMEKFIEQADEKSLMSIKWYFLESNQLSQSAILDGIDNSKPPLKNFYLMALSKSDENIPNKRIREATPFYLSDGKLTQGEYNQLTKLGPEGEQLLRTFISENPENSSSLIWSYSNYSKDKRNDFLTSIDVSDESGANKTVRFLLNN